MKRVITLIIDVYKLVLSGLLVFLFGSGCRFQPTCSQYAKEAISRHGIFKGTQMSILRLMRCHPGASGGFDPVV